MKNKKALSELISYVLLIVISLSLAAGVYAWLKFYMPSFETEECSENTVLSIKDYSCDILNKKFTLFVENKGKFNANGFFIRASENESKNPSIMLNSTLIIGTKVSGISPFSSPLKPGEVSNSSFDYSSLSSIKRIQIQPFVNSTKTGKIILCETMTEIIIENC